jgi:hypothetical protein
LRACAGFTVGNAQKPRSKLGSDCFKNFNSTPHWDAADEMDVVSSHGPVVCSTLVTSNASMLGVDRQRPPVSSPTLCFNQLSRNRR